MSKPSKKTLKVSDFYDPKAIEKDTTPKLINAKGQNWRNKTGSEFWKEVDERTASGELKPKKIDPDKMRNL